MKKVEALKNHSSKYGLKSGPNKALGKEKGDTFDVEDKHAEAMAKEGLVKILK